MNSKHVLVAALLPVVLLTTSAVQKRAKTQGPADFPAIVRAAGVAWEKEEFGACVKQLQSALGLATEKRASALRAAFPSAQEGWTQEPEKKAAKGNPLAAAMAGAIGNVVQVSYTQAGGAGRVSATLTADSPLVQMFTMWMANPALLGQGAELIEYDAHKAVLKPEGKGFHLQILINGAHLCEVRAQGIDEDTLFAMFDQAVVDRLAKMLGK